MIRLLLVGHGRMGQLVERLAPEYGCEIGAIVTEQDPERTIAGAPGTFDVAIDFTAPDAVARTMPHLAARGINVVIGTTGWQADEAAVRACAASHGIGVVAASNFSIGLHTFRAAVARAAAGFADRPGVEAWIHEAHHSGKKDAPSGTALTLQESMREAGFSGRVDMSSTRAGSIPGTHTVGFDGPSETVALTHTVRDRAVFARGALEVARWLVGRRGWFTIDDVLKEQLR